MKIRIATRTSPLALLQTNQVISLIESAEPSSVPSFSLPDANGVVPDLSQFPIKPAIPQSTSPVRDVSLEP